MLFFNVPYFSAPQKCSFLEEVSCVCQMSGLGVFQKHQYTFAVSSAEGLGWELSGVKVALPRHQRYF